MILSLRFFTSYFVDVDTFYLFLNWFSTRVSDDQKYLSGSRLYACINTQKFKGLDSREITWLPDISGQISKKWFKWYVISIIAENKSHAHYKTHLHKVKVYNTRPSQLWSAQTIPYFRPKWSKLIPYFRPKRLKKNIPFGAAHAYIAYIGD